MSIKVLDLRKNITRNGDPIATCITYPLLLSIKDEYVARNAVYSLTLTALLSDQSTRQYVLNPVRTEQDWTLDTANHCLFRTDIFDTLQIQPPAGLDIIQLTVDSYQIADAQGVIEQFAINQQIVYGDLVKVTVKYCWVL